MSGTIIITGASGSLAVPFITHLASLYPTYTLLLTVRSTNPTPTSLLPLLTSTPSLLLEPLDLSSLTSVRLFTTSVLARITAGTLPPLHAIVCNAMFWNLSAPRVLTEDGFEAGFQITHLAHFQLVLSLLAGFRRPGGRVVIIGSGIHEKVVFPAQRDELVYPAGGASVGGGLKEGMERYGWAKLSNVVFLNELNRRLEEEEGLGVHAVAMDPGHMPDSRVFGVTGAWVFRMVNAALRWFLTIELLKGWMQGWGVWMAEDSGRELVELVVGERGGKKGYWIRNVEGGTSGQARQEEMGREIWGRWVEWSGLKEGETVLRNWR